MKLVHLKGKGFSGRGVKLRELQIADIEAASKCAAGEIGVDATNLDFSMAQSREFVLRSIVAVTEAGMGTMDAVRAATFTRVTQEQLEDDGAYSYQKLFTPKDWAFLRRHIRSLYDISDEELADLEGKALELSEG